MDPKKQKILAGALALAAVVVLARGMTAKPARKNSASQSAPSAVSPAAVSAPEPSRPPLSANPAQADEWGDNPFLEDRRKQPPGTVPEEGNLILNGILWDSKAPAAIISDKVVGVGGKVGEWQVVEIQKDRVVLTDGAVTRTLESK